MCAFCEGETHEDFVDSLRCKVSRFGFTLMSVGDGPEDRGVVYTIGLIDECDHPELLISGYPIADAAEILCDVGRFVSRGHRIDQWRSFRYKRAAKLGLVQIDEEHLRDGLMAAWNWCYGDVDVGRLTALQVLLPDGSCCFRHQTTQPVLGPLKVRRHPNWMQRDDNRVVIRLPQSV
ncbi:MAG TPA: DUF4262 domain-containing protein [Acidimicrobiales bacterium]